MATRTWVDGAAPYLSAANLNAMEADIAAAASGRGIIAPAPSGDTTGVTDQAALQPLLLQAQTTGGTLFLRSGDYYVTGLVTNQSFHQPRIQGTGRDYCFLHGVSGATKPVVKFKGGSGAAAGGGVSDVAFLNPGGVGLQIADADSTTHYRLVFDSCTVGVQFYNESPGGFAEFNVVYDSDYHATCLTAVDYLRGGGNESFHGSGIDGNTTINSGAGSTAPSIRIGAGSLPYQSPLSFTAFPGNTVPVIQNLNNGGTRAPQFYGTIRIETVVTNVVLGGTYRIHFDGYIQKLGATGMSNGTIVETAATYYSNGGVFVRRKPWVVGAGPISSSPSIIAPIEPGIGQIVDTTLVAANYAYRYLLWVSSSPYDGGGSVSVLAVHGITNGAGYNGVTSWSVSGYNLFASGSGFPAAGSSTITAASKITASGEFNLIN